MNVVSGLVAVSVLSVANALSADAAGHEAREIVARADAITPSSASVAEQSPVEELVGAYETDSGLTILVVEEGGSLSIEWPEGFDAARLRADETGEFYVAQSAALVTFVRDRDGGVMGMSVYPPGADTAVFAAKRALPRGIVTIEDLDAPVYRGIVTIEDVVDTAQVLKVAAN